MPLIGGGKGFDGSVANLSGQNTDWNVCGAQPMGRDLHAHVGQKITERCVEVLQAQPMYLPGGKMHLPGQFAAGAVWIELMVSQIRLDDLGPVFLRFLLHGAILTSAPPCQIGKQSHQLPLYFFGKGCFTPD